MSDSGGSTPALPISVCSRALRHVERRLGTAALLEAGCEPESLLLPREWIDARDAGSGDVPHVSRRDGETVHLRRCGQQSVDDGQWIGNVHAPPFFCDGTINRENPIAETFDQAPQPSIQCSCAPAVAPLDAVDALPKLANRQNAEKNLVLGQSGKPFGDQVVAALTLSELGDDVGIDEVAHSFTRRPLSCTRAKSSSRP